MSLPMPGSESEDLLEAAELLKGERVKEAITLLEKTLGTLELTYGEDQPELTGCLAILSDAYAQGGRLNDALRISKRQLELARVHYGQVSPAVAGALLKLAKITNSLGRTAEGLSICRQSLETAKQCMQENDPLSQQIIQTYNYLYSVSQGSFQSDDSQAGTFAQLSGTRTDEQAGATALPDEAVGDEPPGLPESQVKNKTDYSQIKAARTRAMPKQQGKEVLGRKLKSLVVPVLAIGAVLALIIFFLTRPKAPEPAKTEASNSKVTSNSKIQKRYLTTDDKAEVRLLDNNKALFGGGNVGVELPYHEVALDTKGLLAIMSGSMTEEQYMFAKTDSTLTDKNGTIYYSMDGPERQVITKMRRLAGFAQAYYLRMGEYPRLITNDMLSQFSFLNPVSGKDSPITLKTFTEKTSEGMDTRAMLDAGTLQIDEKKVEPCSITCYTVVTTVTDVRGEKLKGIKFYVRGYDSKGQLLQAGPSAGKKSAYVETASDASLLNIEAPRSAEVKTSTVKARAKSAGKTTAKNSTKSANNAESKEQNHSTDTTVPTMKAETRPYKASSLWLIQNPPCPMALIHYALPILLVAFSIASFLAAQMQGFNMKGERVSSGSQLALCLSGILLMLAILALARIYTLA